MIAIVALIASGCAPELPTPVVESVAPEWGYNGEVTDIEIVGRDLYPSVQASGGGRLSWDRQFRAWLVGSERVELDDVELVDYQRIAAQVPAGIEPGLYGLEIESPTGETAGQADVFTVTDTRADHLALVLDETSEAVNNPVILRVELRDPNEALVADDLEIEIEIEAEDGDASAVSFDDAITLDGQEELEDGLGVRGRLDANGEGALGLTSSEPVTLTIRASAAADDSVVTGDRGQLQFTAGEVAGVRIGLPTMVSTAAGAAFNVSLTLVDADGNPTTSVEAGLLLYETCPGGTLHEAVSFIDALSSQQVSVTRATNEDCESNSIAAVGFAGGVEISGESDPFLVVAAPASRLDVFASPDEVQAGSEELAVWIEARDDYDNLADGYEGGTPVLVDSVGGLDPVVGMGQQSCTPFTSALSRSWCTVALWKTGAEVTIRATDELGLSGESNAISVVPGDLHDILVSVGVTEVVAGDPFEVLLIGVDEHENPIDVDFESAGDLSFQDGSGPIECTATGRGATAVGQLYECVVTRALESDTVTAWLDIDGDDMSDATEPFDVINADIDTVTIDLGGVTEITAGDELDVTFSAYDAYDNPYLIGTDRALTLTDDGGSVALVGGGAIAELDGEGVAEVTLIFTTAREGDRLHAAVSGTTLGTSTAFDVVAADLSGFEVEPERTWAWIDEPMDVTIRAVDAWGNAVESFANAVTLRSEGGLGDDLSVTSWSDGVAVASYEFDTAELDDTLQIYYAGTLEGVSDAVDALDPSCTNGPRASLLIAGESTATLCLSSGTTPMTTISAAESDAGAASLSVWHWDLGDDDWTRSADDSMDLSWDEEGGWRVTVVVADANACGDTDEAELYVAESDGRAAGPIDVQVDDDTLTNGVDDALVEITATDCAGDPAVGDVYVRVNLGALTDGVSSTLVQDDEGLAVALVGGVADLKWTVVDEIYDGDGVLHVGALSGAAYGSAEATISGDSSPPFILSVTPSGSTQTAFDEVVISFSEALLSRSVTSAAFSLEDSSGNAMGFDAVTLAPSGSAVTLKLDSSAGRNVWQLTATEDLRDESGNKLDGTWIGSAGDFVLSFGDLLATRDDVTACEVNTALFRPDGNEGADEEADEVWLTLSASGLPTWWRMEVLDESGATVYMKRLYPGGASGDPQLWDGRSQDGRIVDNGLYTLRISAEDAAWNVGESCSVEVSVDNRVVGISP